MLASSQKSVFSRPITSLIRTLLILQSLAASPSVRKEGAAHERPQRSDMSIAQENWQEEILSEFPKISTCCLFSPRRGSHVKNVFPLSAPPDDEVLPASDSEQGARGKLFGQCEICSDSVEF